MEKTGLQLPCPIPLVPKVLTGWALKMDHAAKSGMVISRHGLRDGKDSFSAWGILCQLYDEIHGEDNWHFNTNTEPPSWSHLGRVCWPDYSKVMTWAFGRDNTDRLLFAATHPYMAQFENFYSVKKKRFPTEKQMRRMFRPK